MDSSKRDTALSDTELNSLTQKDTDKLVELLRSKRQKLLDRSIKIQNLNTIKNDNKIIKEQKFIKKMQEGYKKYYDNNYDTLIKRFVDKLESIVGENININNANIYLKNNIYIIDHNQFGQSSDLLIIKEAVYKPNHEYFKQDVLILTKDKLEIYYNSIENNLIGYKEKGKNYVDVSGTGKFVKINYSIENKLRYIGFDNKYINTNDYQIDDIYSKEKLNNKDIVDGIMRNRINALKKLLEYSQKIIYQIKNKKTIQIIEKGLSDVDKIKHKFLGQI